MSFTGELLSDLDTQFLFFRYFRPTNGLAKIKDQAKFGTRFAKKYAAQQSFLLNPLPRAFDLVLAKGCVSDAVAEVGPAATEDHTWFVNCAHRILACTKCGGHIGWTYENRDIPKEDAGAIIETEYSLSPLQEDTSTDERSPASNSATADQVRCRAEDADEESELHTWKGSTYEFW